MSDRLTDSILLIMWISIDVYWLSDGKTYRTFSHSLLKSVTIRLHKSKFLLIISRAITSHAWVVTKYLIDSNYCSLKCHKFTSIVSSKSEAVVCQSYAWPRHIVRDAWRWDFCVLWLTEHGYLVVLLEVLTTYFTLWIATILRTLRKYWTMTSAESSLYMTFLLNWW